MAGHCDRQMINNAVSLFLRFGKIEAQGLLDTPVNEQNNHLHHKNKILHTQA